MNISFKKSIIYGLFLILGYYLFTAFSIYSFSKKDQTQKADAAIVLGTAVWGDEPSPVFKERIRHGIWLYEKQYVDFLIFTGGKAEGQKYSEAEVARKYAMEKSVPTSKIFIEEKSTITDENLAYAKLILQEKNFQKALIVSDPLHMKRAMVMMHDHGIKGFSSPTPTSNFKSFGKKLGFAFRESFFLIAYRIQRIFTSTD